MHERFRWPIDQVLLVGLGVVAVPTPTDPNPVLNNVPGLNGPPRSDLLVFIESKGQMATGTPTPVPAAATTAPTPRPQRHEKLLAGDIKTPPAAAGDKKMLMMKCPAEGIYHLAFFI